MTQAKTSLNIKELDSAQPPYNSFLETQADEAIAE
jgi:hypothetical protein